MNKPFFSLLISVLCLTGCSSVLEQIPGVYNIDIEQGNIIDQDMIDQLRPNMTKRQVLYIMGSPMLTDMFHQERWDYLYSKTTGGEENVQKRLTLIFNGENLVAVQGDLKPSALPVEKPSKETSLDLPKRELDNSWWGQFSRWWRKD